MAAVCNQRSKTFFITLTASRGKWTSQTVVTPICLHPRRYRKHPSDFFTDEEVGRLWEIRHEPWVDSVLVFLYSGWRISELLDLKTADVDLQIGTMTGGTKTKAGKNRIVPIHSLIAEMVSKRVSEGGEYLFSCDGGKCEKTKYYSLWNDIMKRTNMSHTPHECRHTFRTWLDRVGANRVAINKIMGYSGGDTSERVYTHKTIQDLKFNIELVTR